MLKKNKTYTALLDLKWAQMLTEKQITISL